MKRRRNSRGQYISKWEANIRPLLWLMVGVAILGLVWTYFKKSEVIGPCEGGCDFFMVRAAEPEIIEELKISLKDEKQQIIEYIVEVFEEDAPDAFNILYCENRNLKTDAENWNRNGTWDAGIFQINEIHGKSLEDMKNWKKNIDFAHELFERGGWSQWSCSHRIGVTPFYLK